MEINQSTLWKLDSTDSSSGAIIVGAYRYRLWRSWDPGKPRALFIMLNPSDGNQIKDDPTLKRCVSFAKSWEMGSIEVVNLFGLISPYPEALKRAIEPVGSENDTYIQQALTRAALIVLAWGACKHIGQRDREVVHLLERKETYCLGLTQGGFPRHPLYLASETPLVPYSQKGKNE